jgi:hypothetical protein
MSNVSILAASVVLTVVVGTGLVLHVRSGPLRARADSIEAALAIPAYDVPRMEQALQTIEDPIVRQSVLLEWVRLRRGELSPMSASPLCEVLEGAERVVCLRRVGSPHLAEGAGP